MGNQPVEASAVLDHMVNPHPRMWEEARVAYQNADLRPNYWAGFLDAMCAATGYTRAYFLEKLSAEG